MKKITLFLMSLLFATMAFSQTKSFWQKEAQANISKVKSGKENLPRTQTYSLDIESMKAILQNAPMRGEFKGKSNLIIAFPNHEGVLENFRIMEAPVMHPDLMVKYPNIKSYAGQGVEDPTARIRFSVSPLGLQSMQLSANSEASFIEPYTNDLSLYTVYKRSDKTPKFDNFECKVKNAVDQKLSGSSTMKNADDGLLRTYRLAVSATGEYTQYHGGTKALALAAINTTMTRVNGIYENDFNVTMVLIANTDDVIYTSTSSDPYSSSSTSSYNSALQSTLTNVIGEANYDVGHLFANLQNNGNAGCIGCVCVDGQKGSGWTSHTVPEGDPFDVDYVAHELGHQFGGNHTWTFNGNEGTNVQMEPGSGSTIMGYAGITGATDVQAHSDPYFHAISIEQITDYIKSTSCQTNTSTGNAVPTVNAGSNYTIPKGTAFVLDGSATDANSGDVLTYCWEQIDENNASSTYPSTTATTGVAFRSFNPTTDSKRYFPRMSTIKTGAISWQWEAVPNVARSLNFRLTVRDNVVGGGNNNSDDMVVTVNGTAGPFVVNSPNTNVTWNAGTTQTVTWDVAGTTGNGVNAANVDIFLSTDGGDTYPISLASGVPNDGSHDILVPNNQGSQNRIMVKGSNNIFFDISNSDFTIAGQVVCNATIPTGLAASNIGSNSATLSWAAVAGASFDLQYRVVGSGTWTTISVNGVSTALSGLSPLTQYEAQVRSKCPDNSTSAYSGTINFTTTDVQLNYCNSASTNVNDEYISRVQLNTIDNSSGAQFYSDFTSQSTTLTKNTQYTITITPTWTGTVYSEGYSVWIDYNRDGDFSDAGEQVWTQAATQATPVSGNFTIPTSAVENSTRMRVSMKYNGIPTSCETFTYGEVEDYTVNLVAGAADTTPPVITLNGASTIDLEVGDTYTELGATATDNVDGDISANIVITGTVNTNAEGTYTRYYNVSDAAGNAATQVTRTINVTQPTVGTCSTTVSSFPYSEGFESNFGAWTQSTDDDMDWTRDSNGTPSSSTGPSNAAEGTYYIYTEASSPNYPSKVAILEGPCFDVSGLSNPTLTFQYHMYGATMGTLSLQARPDGSNTWTTIWSLSGNQGNAWQQAEVSLSSYSTIQLRFNNSTGTSYTGDATVDDINVFDNVVDSEAPSVPTNLVASNTTETTTDLSWNASSDNVAVTGYDVYQDGSLVASVTGTSHQVTGLTPSTAYSFYVTAKDAAGNVSGNSNTVNVTTATPADTTPPIITLIGASTINLQVGDTYTEQGATATDNVDGDISANIVITGTVDTNTAGTYSRFYNVSDAAGNAATQVSRTIIVMQPSTGGCSGGITSFPYSESFENTLGAWTQSSADDFNWTVDANGTPSSNTGPSSASAGTYYVYMESSSPNYSNKRAILNSPCFDLGSESQASFTFDYHMYGASSMGSLALELSDDDGATWTNVWSKSGNQGNSWQSASVNLDAYAGGSIQLRFNGITGTTWQGDMAVDNVGLSTSGGGGTGCSNVTLSITFDNYPEETAWSITNASGQTVASGGTYGSQADGSTLNINVGCLDDGCYDFTITDTYGDGICCAYGNGSYTLTNNDTGVTLASGGSFASSETTNFCVGGTTRSQSDIVNTTDDIDKHLTVYPNPVDNMLNVDLIGFEAQTFVVKNMLGQVVLNGRYTSTIDVSDLKSGVYVLQLNIDEKTKVKRFIKK